jgi:hypothetical protein
VCRSIKVLRIQEHPATPEEVNAAALQFVRKISGYHHPSRANQEAFDLAIAEIAAASKRLLESLVAPRRAEAPKHAERPDRAESPARARMAPGLRE